MKQQNETENDKNETENGILASPLQVLQKMTKTRHETFLHNLPSVSAFSEFKHSSSINIRPLRHFEEVTATVSELRGKLEDILKDTWTNMSLTITQPDVLLSGPEPEPKTRAGFLRYSCDITLDPDTAHQLLALSDGDRKVLVVNQHQSYPDRPDRFSFYYQVLSRESLTRRCYWESVSRSGDESAFGTFDDSVVIKSVVKTGLSWCMTASKTPSQVLIPSRVGVYLDHSAGILSFYSISETMTLLHRVQTTFTEPLHAGLWVRYGWRHS
uniref:SPRY-associated domain-containing protein n=1 Tax=Amphiprion percula TaxID=161767 RepID=A0A3P8RW11_AMPPE